MPRLQIVIPDDLAADVRARGSESEGGRNALERYFILLARGRQELRLLLSTQEVSLLCDIYNGTLFTPYLPDSLAMGAEDCEPEYYCKWNVDRAALLAKLKAFSWIQGAALIDAIERFWRATETGMQVHLEGVLL